MHWEEARREFPDTWLLIEALAARTEGRQREVAELAVVTAFDDSATALRRYLDLHRLDPARELYVFHTSRERLEIEERRWVGVRPA